MKSPSDSDSGRTVKYIILWEEYSETDIDEKMIIEAYDEEVLREMQTNPMSVAVYDVLVVDEQSGKELYHISLNHVALSPDFFDSNGTQQDNVDPENAVRQLLESLRLLQATNSYNIEELEDVANVFTFTGVPYEAMLKLNKDLPPSDLEVITLEGIDTQSSKKAIQGDMELARQGLEKTYGSDWLQRFQEEIDQREKQKRESEGLKHLLRDIENLNLGGEGEGWKGEDVGLDEPLGEDL